MQNHNANSKQRIVRAGLTLIVVGAITTPALAFDPDTGTISPPDPARIKHFKSRTVKIDFELRSGRNTVTGVDLWFTDTRSATWTQATLANANASPIVWTAPHDGLYGLYLIVSNAAGASSPPPTSGAAPHQWVQVDAASAPSTPPPRPGAASTPPTPPTATVTSIERDAQFATNRRLQILWSAAGGDLAPRPIDIYYCRTGDDIFNLIATSLSNDGAFRWTVPSDVAGSLKLKVVARDRAGQAAEAFSAPIEVPADNSPHAAAAESSGPNISVTDAVTDVPPAASPAPTRPTPRAEQTRPHSPPMPDVLDSPATPATDDPPPPRPTPRPSKPIGRAAAALERADTLRASGEWELAEQQFNDALQADPDSVEARLGLASVLTKQRKLDAAEAEYTTVMRSAPGNIEALRGLAMVQVARRRYAAAAKSLDDLLQRRPDDAEALIISGDVAMLMGEKTAARRAWRKVESLPDVPADVADRARKRLVIYPADDQP